MTVKFFEKLSNNYLELLDDKEDFNIIIKVGESPKTKIFQAHSTILRYRSLYFRNELANISKDKNNIKTLDLKNVSILQFEIIINLTHLPDDLQTFYISDNDIIDNATNPKKKPFSTVINEAHAEELLHGLIKKNTYSLTNNPYEFKLLLRGTRDGFTKDSYWNLCDKQAQLVVVMKVKGTDEILGGYNPIGWDKSVNYSFKNCNDSFIFSLKNGTIQNSILSRVIQPEYAIYCYNKYGPRFGGCDLIMSYDFNQDRNCWHQQKSYEKRIRNASTFESSGYTYFSVEYEIFQISKKT
ncbi:hypothetical protein C2G38_2244215 [Gigaspora rosea]|uniref:TLDc domain-containing protein n=1 Tax=Gigaspora rosea TaxID=44941 RepID=A0A397VET2_9GLOM|nr:hypothetical protein C2G38_2244215 [Gigaspora rosea]